MDHTIPVDNETSAEFSRVTKEGRKLTYKLNVLQQPEKARACGSGAKSSADRRPVDPPPIVELKIYEGEGAKTDITFTMNANYFLFATLEQARPIAQGRVQQESSRATVLTGTPVSGLVYLDRPHPAGYFLFPDLSVRHEGKYRLSFNLYEELKEDKDEDKTIVKDEKDPHSGHVTHRLEVKSRPFIVYSAKKFPGLNQSTELSRTVAEQGCRVRIRRDARVRKRGKNGQDIDCSSDGPGGDMYTAPAGDRSRLPNRQRSSSVESHRSIAPAVSRRSSEQGPTPSYHPGPQYGHNPPPNAGSAPFPAPYGQAPAHSAQNYQAAAYYHGAPYGHSAMAPPPHARQPAYHYGYQQPVPQHAAPTASRHNSVSHPASAPAGPVTEAHYQFRGSVPDARPGASPEYRSAAGSAPVSAYQYPAGPTHSHAQQLPAPSQPPAEPVYHQEPPKDAPPTYAASYPNGQIASHRMLPALNTGNQIPSRLLEPASPASSGPSPVFSDGPRSFKPFGGPEVNGSANGKRSYGQVFDTLHMDGPMRAGARPAAGVAMGHAASLRVDHDEPAEDPALASLRMSYKRADGRQITKSLTLDH